MPRKSKSIQDAADRAERTSAGVPEDMSDREFGSSEEEPKTYVTASGEEPSAPATYRDPGGRPTEYKEEFCRVAAEMLLVGATEEEVAEEIGVTTRTFLRWKSIHPEFCRVFEVSKEEYKKNLNSRVERSLYNRAVGYTYDTVKVFSFQGTPTIVPVKEHVPPDISAAKYWLENRTEDWKSAPTTQVNNLTLEAGDIDKLVLARWIAEQFTKASETKVIEAEDEP